MSGPEIPKSAIVRERSAALEGSGASGAERALEFALRAAGVEGWEREHHFLWCCEHPEAEHKRRICNACVDDASRNGGSLFAAYHVFARERDWRFDFAWPDERLAVEVDGGVHSGGRHVRGDGFTRDLEKLNAATLLGWRVLRVTPGMVDDGTALELVERGLAVAEAV